MRLGTSATASRLIYAVVVIPELFCLFLELPETSKGVGFEEGTQLSSKKLVEDDIFNLNCRISLFQCSAENVQINRGNTVWTKQTEGVTWNL